MILTRNPIQTLYKSQMYKNFHLSSAIYGHWMKDYKIGPLPNSTEDHALAAKKYNLHPKEYKTYTDNEYYGTGDYPKLPLKGIATLDPHYPYDQPEYRRNFNEPIHIHFEVLDETRSNVGEKWRYSPRFIFSFYFFLCGSLLYLCYNDPVIMFQPVTEKQYPWKGNSYYTFESSN